MYFSWISQYVLHLSWWSFWCCFAVFFGRLSGCLEFPIDRSAAGGNLCTSVPWLWLGVLHTGVGFICLFSAFAIRSVPSLRLSLGVSFFEFRGTVCLYLVSYARVVSFSWRCVLVSLTSSCVLLVSSQDMLAIYTCALCLAMTARGSFLGSACDRVQNG